MKHISRSNQSLQWSLVSPHIWHLADPFEVSSHEPVPQLCQVESVRFQKAQLNLIDTLRITISCCILAKTWFFHVLSPSPITILVSDYITVNHNWRIHLWEKATTCKTWITSCKLWNLHFILLKLLTFSAFPCLHSSSAKHPLEPGFHGESAPRFSSFVQPEFYHRRLWFFYVVFHWQIWLQWISDAAQ